LVKTPSFIGGFNKIVSHAELSGSTDYDGKYTTQLITNLKRSTSYRFMISAKNTFQTNNRTGAWSPLSKPSLRATTLATIPSPPKNKPTISNVGATTMKISWIPSADNGGNKITHYILWRKTTTCEIVCATVECVCCSFFFFFLPFLSSCFSSSCSSSSASASKFVLD
jgi:hypothetical protein